MRTPRIRAWRARTQRAGSDELSAHWHLLEPGALLVTGRPYGCAVVGDAQLVLERSGLLQVPLPLWCPGQQAAKLGVPERGVEWHGEPLGRGQAGPPGRPGPSRPAGEVQQTPIHQQVTGLADGEDTRKGQAAQWRADLGAVSGRGAIFSRGTRHPAVARKVKAVDVVVGHEVGTGMAAEGGGAAVRTGRRREDVGLYARRVGGKTALGTRQGCGTRLVGHTAGSMGFATSPEWAGGSRRRRRVVRWEQGTGGLEWAEIPSMHGCPGVDEQGRGPQVARRWPRPRRGVRACPRRAVTSVHAGREAKEASDTLGSAMRAIPAHWL